MSALSIFAAFIVSLIGSWIMIKISITDTPNARSIHERPTPSAGGVAIFMGVAAGLIIGGIFGQSLFDQSLFAPSLFGSAETSLGRETLPIILGSLTLIGGVGLLDDIFRFGVKSKMAAMIIAALISAAVLGPVPALPLGPQTAQFTLPIWLGFAGAAVWIFAVMNVVNFTDGANGFIGLNISGALIAVLAFLGMTGGLGSAPAAWASLLLAGVLGFLPFNARRKAALFAGDVGALVIGYLYAVIVLLAAAELPQTGAIYLGPLFILPLLTDVFLTLIRRIKAGHNPLVAHKDHIFQRLISKGYSHLSVGGFYLLTSACLAAIGIGAERLSLARSPLMIIGLSLILSGVYLVLYRKTQP